MIESRHITNAYKNSVGLFIVFLFLATQSHALTELQFFQTDKRYDYRIALLSLAMEKTLKSHGPYILVPFNEVVTQQRGLHILKKNKGVNIAFLASNRDREKDFLSIKIPILRGILGYRVFLIKDLNEGKFSNIQSLQELKDTMVAGFGSQWADMAILTSNQLPVIGSVKYETLFGMLSKGRFDYFPRGINEAWLEIENKQNNYPRLIVEPSMALYYPYPVYFHVQKQNTPLAQRITQGLEIALQDGSFKALFLKFHKALIDRAQLSNRRFFVLDNPNLPPDTPHPDTSWWLPKGRLY